MKFVALAAVVLAVLACSEKRSEKSTDDPRPASTATDDWQGVCDAYIDQCADKEDSRKNLYRKLSGCLAKCTAANHMQSLEMCIYVFCGVKTGKCDNEEPGDKAILACVKERGWKL